MDFILRQIVHFAHSIHRDVVLFTDIPKRLALARQIHYDTRLVRLLFNGNED